MTTKFIDDYLPYLLARTSFLVSSGFHTHLKTHGIAAPVWRVLVALADGDGLTVGDLATIVLAQQPTLTKILDRMESDRLIRRVQDDKDRRRSHVCITDKGRSELDRLLPLAREHEAQILGRYPPERAKEIKELLRSLIDDCSFSILPQEELD